MPNLITHELLGQEVLKEIPTPLKNTITHFPKEFSLGTSGPDCFFYYNSWPWLDQKKAKKIASLGSQIHNRNIQQFFKIIFEDAKSHPSPAKISYLAGFVCHWALDKEAHPYIFNQTGNPKDPTSILDHRRFESHLDYLMLQQIKGCSIQEYPGYKLLQFDQHTVDAITDFYQRPILEIQGHSLSKKEVYTSLRHFYGIQKFLYDPHALKFDILHTLEKKIFRNPYIFSSLIVPEQPDYYDILNLQHRFWEHPCTNVMRDESFLELFNEAIVTAKKVLSSFQLYLNNQLDLSDLLTLIDNQSFETGLPHEQEMHYFTSIYKN